jgi:hypothetical protein
MAVKRLDGLLPFYPVPGQRAGACYTHGMKKITDMTITLCLGLLIAACSKVNSLEKKTENLDKTASDMSYTAEDIKQIANSLYPQLRSGNTIGIRDNQWEILTDEKKGLGGKMVAAGIYFQSL